MSMGYSKTLSMLLEHWDVPLRDEEGKAGYGIETLPFDVQSFCIEMDKELIRLEGCNGKVHLDKKGKFSIRSK